MKNLRSDSDWKIKAFKDQVKKEYHIDVTKHMIYGAKKNKLSMMYMGIIRSSMLEFGIMLKF